MYQLALVKMLHNIEAKKWHPIFYYDKPFPGGFKDGGINDAVIRYKSKGHHTTGFDKREDAVKSANELIDTLRNRDHDTVLVEIDEKDDILWDGKEIPADTQLRPISLVKK